MLRHSVSFIHTTTFLINILYTDYAFGSLHPRLTENFKKISPFGMVKYEKNFVYIVQALLPVP